MPEAPGGILALAAPFRIAASEWAFCAAPISCRQAKLGPSREADQTANARVHRKQRPVNRDAHLAPGERPRKLLAPY
jgi:hypothetical protein